MAKKRQWTWALDRRIKPKVPEEVKAEVEREATELIEKHLKPRHVKPLPENGRGNYLTCIHTKWYRSFFYLVADLASLGPGALSPGFELPFARMEYLRDGTFNLAYFRHTGEWWHIHKNLTLAQAMKALRDEGTFHPPGK